MPHPIVEIDELVRPIIDYLVESSLAGPSRSLRLVLWKRQSSFITLLHVLLQFNRVRIKGYSAPQFVSVCDFPWCCVLYQFSQAIVGDPTGTGCDNLLPGCG